jgi:putative FmdB family regulatory protein
LPIFEFICEECGDKKEIICTRKESRVKHICSCGGNLKKILSPVNFRGSGDGWYNQPADKPKDEKGTT